jgi:hypothetical protein
MAGVDWASRKSRPASQNSQIVHTHTAAGLWVRGRIKGVGHGSPRGVCRPDHCRGKARLRLRQHAD